MFKTPDIRKNWGTHQQIKNLHASIIFPKLSTEVVHMSVHLGYIH